MKDVLRSVVNTKSHWIIACNAGQVTRLVQALGGGVSSYRAQGAGEKDIGNVLEYSMVSESSEMTNLAGTLGLRGVKWEQRFVGPKNALACVNLSQQVVVEQWSKLANDMEDEVLKKYQIQEHLEQIQRQK